MELFRVDNGKKDDTLKTDAEINQALMAGTHSLKKGSRVWVKNPENENVTIDADTIFEAMQSGYKVLGPESQSIERYVQENKGLKGDIKVGLTQLADEALFGVPEMVYEKKADPLNAAKWEALKNDHELANLAGGVAGFGANLFVGGPVYKAAGLAGDAATKAAEKVLASRIAGKIGEEASTRSVNQVARQILAKSAGTGVEGALSMAPQAITEASLGDIELAGESLAWGGGLGAVLGAGGKLTGEFLGVGKRFVNSSFEKLEGRPIEKGDIVRKLQNLAFGVPESHIQHYVDNMERVQSRGSLTIENLKDDLDSSVSKYMAEESSAMEAYSYAKKQADDAFNIQKASLKDEKPTLEMANNIIDDIRAADDLNFQLATERDKLLDAAAWPMKRMVDGVEETVLEQVAFPKSIVLNAIEKESFKIGKDVGPAKKQAINMLSNFFTDINQNYGSSISASEMREIMAVIRNENKAAFLKLPGEQNVEIQNSLMSLSEGMSDILKENVPGYAKKMEEMAPLASLRKEMSKAFGTPERAMNSIRSLTGDKSEITMGLLDRWGKLRGQDFVTPLRTYLNAKALLKAEKTIDLRKLLIPNLETEALEAFEKYSAIKERNAPLKYLGEKSTQNVIQNLKRKEPNIEQMRALDFLSELEGRTPGDDFATIIKDRHVYDSFNLERTNGSRRVNEGFSLGSAIGGSAGLVVGGPMGGVIGGATGGFVGATVGYTIDQFGGRILRQYLSAKDMAGPIFAESRLKILAQKIGEIPKVLDDISKKNDKVLNFTPKIEGMGRLSAIKAFIGVKESELLSDEEAIEKVSERLSSLSANPVGLSGSITTLLDPIYSAGGPEISSIASQRLMKAVTYLESIVPKPYRVASPFSMKSKWKPSSFEVKVFNDELTVALEPFQVFDKLKDGSLTKNHVKALKELYPSMHEAITGKVLETVALGKIDLGYQERLKLGLLLGYPIDDTLRPETIAAFQQSYLKASADQDTSGKPVAMDASGRSATDLQRREMN